LRKYIKIITDQLLQKNLKPLKQSVKIEDIINLDIMRGLELLKDDQLGIMSLIYFGPRYHDCFGCDSHGLEHFKYYGNKILYIPKRDHGLFVMKNGKIFLEFQSFKGNITPYFKIKLDQWDSWDEYFNNRENSKSVTLNKKDFYNYQGGFAFDSNEKTLLIKEVIINRMEKK